MSEQTKKELEEKREALRVFRFNAGQSRVKNVREGRTLRREIARLLTKVHSEKP